MGRELRGLAALRRVDQLRVEFASGEAERVQRAARRWLQGLPQHSGILPALAAADTPETVLALLRSGPAQALQDATEVLGRTAALQSVAIVAATPSPAMDVLTVGWCGVRLIRQVAALHGMRPGMYGDAVIATEDGLGCGDGCRCGDRRERRHSCDGVASAIATLGGRCRRCRGGSPPHDRVGARSRSGLFTDIAWIARPLRHHWPHGRGCAAPTDAAVGCPTSISDQAGSGCWHWLGPRICRIIRWPAKGVCRMGIELPHEYQPSADEEFMNPKQVEYFRRRLEESRADLRRELDAILPPEAHDISPGGRPDRPCQCGLGTRICGPKPRTDPEVAAANGTSAFKA